MINKYKFPFKPDKFENIAKMAISLFLSLEIKIWKNYKQ